jgi:hypothetical protein
MSRMKLNIFEIREDLWSIKLQNCGDVDNYASQIDRKVEDYNLCVRPTATSSNATEAADTDTDLNAKTIAKMSDHEHIFYLLCGIRRNDECNVIRDLMMDEKRHNYRPARSDRYYACRTGSCNSVREWSRFRCSALCTEGGQSRQSPPNSKEGYER